MCTTSKSTAKEHKSTHALFLFASRGHDSKQPLDASCQHSFPFSLAKINTNTNTKAKKNTKTSQTNADAKTKTYALTNTKTNTDEKTNCLKNSSRSSFQSLSALRKGS